MLQFICNNLQKYLLNMRKKLTFFIQILIFSIICLAVYPYLNVYVFFIICSTLLDRISCNFFTLKMLNSIYHIVLHPLPFYCNCASICIWIINILICGINMATFISF